MKPIGMHNYYVYMLTNMHKKVLYTGVTNDLGRRLYEHRQDAETTKKHFAGKYNCIYLVYYERFQWVHDAIDMEKVIKGYSRAKKDKIITGFNPAWEFLNDHFDAMD